MPTVSEAPASHPDERRLHPSTLLFSFARTIRGLILPAVLALISGSESAWCVIFIVLFVISSVTAIVRYATLSWRLDTDELIVRQGVFFKSVRHVPYVRIQNMDLAQNIFHRLFRVADVKIETASGTEPEAVLSVLGMSDVEVLRKRLFRDRQGHTADAEATIEEAQPPLSSDAGEILVRIPAHRLVFLGLVMNRGLAVLGAGMGLLYEFDAFDAISTRLGEDAWLRSVVNPSSLTGVAILALFLFMVMLGLSVAWSLVRFWGFTLRTRGEDLQLACGLFTRVSASIPRQRIQSLTISASWIHRLFGLASIRAQTAGGSSQDENANLARSRFVPVLPAVDAPAIITAALPRIVMGTPDWQSISPKAIARIRRRSVFLIGLPAAPLAVFVTPWTLIGAGVIVAFAWWWAAAYVRRARFARTDWGLVWQRGVVTQKTTFLPEEKVQTVRIAQSPFDRRHGHVTLLVDAAGGQSGTPEVRIRYVDEVRARALFEDLAIAAATTEYQVRAAREPTVAPA